MPTIPQIKARLLHHKSRFVWPYERYSRVDATELLSKFYLQLRRCGYCNGSLINNWSLDHIKPITRGGNHSLSNIWFVCVRCNGCKHNNHAWQPPSEWSNPPDEPFMQTCGDDETKPGYLPLID